MPTTGHAKNVANFETVTIVLNNLVAEYNPSQPLIQIVALETKLTEAKNAMTAADQAEAAKNIAVNRREEEFGGLNKLAVNIKRAAEVEVNDEVFNSGVKFQHGKKA